MKYNPQNQYSFDEESIGVMNDAKTSVAKSAIPRPPGMKQLDWYKHAKRVCQELNKRIPEQPLIDDQSRNGVKVIVRRFKSGTTVEADCSCHGIPGRVHHNSFCPMLRAGNGTLSRPERQKRTTAKETAPKRALTASQLHELAAERGEGGE